MEAYKRTCTRLETQERFAIASDQRALVGAGVAVAAAAFIWQGGSGMNLYLGISFGCFLFSAVAAIVSAEPQKMYTSGSQSSDMAAALRFNANIVDVLEQLCELNDGYIEMNEQQAQLRTVRYNAFRLSFVFGVLFFLLSAASQSTQTGVLGS